MGRVTAMAKKRPQKRPANPIKDQERVYDIQDYLKGHRERDYVLFVLGITTGYRAGDLVKLKVRDIRKALAAGYFEILEGKKANNPHTKNMKPRRVKVIDNLAAILSKYADGHQDYEYMFLSRKGNQPITVNSVSRILAEAGKEFELKNITAHSMRKTYAWCIFVDSGFNITLVMEMLGHSSEKYTRAYLGLDRETYDKYSDGLNSMVRI